MTCAGLPSLLAGLALAAVIAPPASAAGRSASPELPQLPAAVELDRPPWTRPGLEAVLGQCRVTMRPQVPLGEHELQVLDLFLPEPGNGAAVIVVHGGAWHGGDKGAMAATAGLLASHGFVVAAVNYRLAPEWKWPAQLEDCRLGVRWLQQRAEALGIAADRVGALGSSAGGHLAAMLALADGEPTPACKVRAACNYFGPSDLARHSLQSRFTRTVLIDLLGLPPEQAPERYAQASPLTHVDAGDPPVQVCQGGRDTLVPPEQGTALYEALLKAGVPTELVLLEDQGHGFIGRMARDPEARNCFRRSVEWLKKWLVEPEEQ